MIAVAIDVSQPDCATTLYRWLGLVNSAVDEFAARRREKVSDSGAGAGAGQEESKSSPPCLSLTPEGGGAGWRPEVLVVGCKADTLAAEEVDSLARSKATQGALRAVYLHGER